MLSKKVFSLYSSKIMVLFALKKETINLTSRIPWCMDYPIHQGMLCTLGGMHSGSHNEKDDEQLKQDLENLKEQNDILSSELSDLKSRLK